MSAFQDKLRDKWESISPRERVMVVVAAVATINVLILYFALAIKDKLDALEAKNERARVALRKLTAYKASAKAPSGANPLDVIPKEPVKLESYIYKAGGTASVTIPGVNPRTPVTKGDFQVHSATIDLREVTLTQVKDLLHALETDNRAVMVTSLRLTRSFRGGEEKMDLAAEISTYSRISKTPAAGAGSGSGSGSGSAKKGD
jgi:hypothetical protein